jgi:hypothetical protein
MNKVFYIILISLFSLTVFSCSNEDSKTASADNTTATTDNTTTTTDNTTTTTDNTTTTTDNTTTTTDTTRPTVSSISPNDNSTDVSVSTTVAVTFSETMTTSTITTNTDNTTCSGSFHLSSDNFTTCIQMSAAPSASNSDKTFTSTPADNLSRGTNYKLKITTSAKNISSNSLADNYTTTNGFTTYGTGTIRGTVRYSDNNTAADNVSVGFAKSGTIVDNITNEDNGTYILDNLSLGTYTISFTKSGFNDATQTATLAIDNQTVEANVNITGSGCASGTISGQIKDAVTDLVVDNVSISVRSGMNTTSGTIVKTSTTNSSGNYSLLNMNPGWYTVETSKDGYINGYFNVYSCGDQANQGTSISTNIESGSMRIILHWPSNSGLGIVDSHLTGPDNLSGSGHSNRATNRFHLYWNSVSGIDVFYYATNNFSCSGCTDIQKSDNVTLDKDDTAAPGTETITIASGSWRSGTYRYSAHNYSKAGTSGDGNPTNTTFARSGTTVKVYYNGTETTYNVPNIAGTVWKVFTIDGDSKVITTVNSMSAASKSNASTISYFE